MSFHLNDEDVVRFGEPEAVENDVLVHVHHLERDSARVEGFGC